ncbi:MAG: hypothetical protein OEL84_10170 [Nitrosopumilus sp.]|nr:hypothetical protein [Nitrosopumilus sp.]
MSCKVACLRYKAIRPSKHHIIWVQSRRITPHVMFSWNDMTRLVLLDDVLRTNSRPSKTKSIL